MQEVLRGLKADGGVMRREAVEEMFRPQLDAKQTECMREIIWAFGSGAEIPEGAPVNHGIGGLMNVEDVEGKRRKGSLMWSGMCNSRWVSCLGCDTPWVACC
jgi:hypothetical protein